MSDGRSEVRGSRGHHAHGSILPSRCSGRRVEGLNAGIGIAGRRLESIVVGTCQKLHRIAIAIAIAIDSTYRYPLELFDDGLRPRYAPEYHCVMCWACISCSEPLETSAVGTCPNPNLFRPFFSKRISATRLLLANHKPSTDDNEPHLQRAWASALSLPFNLLSAARFIFVAVTPNRRRLLIYSDTASTPLQIQTPSKCIETRQLTGYSRSAIAVCIQHQLRLCYISHGTS